MKRPRQNGGAYDLASIRRRSVAGTSAQHQIIRCGKIGARVTFQVTSCTEYLHRQHPSLWHMEDIAWVLRTDAKRKQIGFVRAKDLKFRDRFVLDED